VIDRIRCPIGMPEITGKQPPVIAVGVACELVLRMQEQAGRLPAGAVVAR
jgi:xanthine/CO dehydrogenase XdhC/CoxF family maturation factor